MQNPGKGAGNISFTSRHDGGRLHNWKLGGKK
jgi:hypothetical protein